MTDHDDNRKPDLMPEIQRFEEMLNNGRPCYFDSETFEEIIDYYLGHNEYKKALRGLDVALSQHPSSTSLMLLKAELFITTGKLLKAKEILDRVEQLEPYNSEVYILKANVFSQQRIFLEAVRSLKKAIRYADEEDKDDLYIDLAIEYENCEKYDKAIECLKHVLKQSPENETALYEISYCYDLAGKNDEALTFYREFIDFHPYSYLAWHHLGTAYLKNQQIDEALEALDYCIAIRDSFSTAYFNKATIMMMQERYAEAIDHFNETVMRGEAIALTYMYLGECYEKLDEDLLAEQSLLKALELEDEMPDIHFALAVLKNKTRQFVEAEFYARRAVQLDESNPDNWYILAEIYEAAGTPDEADKAYIKAVELSNYAVEVVLDYSNFIHLNENIQAAIDWLAEIIQRDPTQAYYHYRLAAFYFMQGRYAMCYEAFEEGLHLDFSLFEQAMDYWPAMYDDENLIRLTDAYRNE